MYKLTDNCLTIIFAKFNILASLILHFLANIEGYTQQDLPMQQGDSVSPHKKWTEAFHSRWGTNCFGQIYWGTVQHGGSMIRSIGNHEGIYTWIYTVNRIVERFIPEVNCSEFSKVVSWLSWPSYFIRKVNSKNRVLLLKNTLCRLCLRG